MNSALLYILQFLIGGSTVVGITLIAKHSDPKYTGILYAFPIILIVSIIFIYVNQGKEISQKVMHSALIYEFTLVFFIIAFYYLLQKTNFWPALLVSLALWILICIALQFCLKT